MPVPEGRPSLMRGGSGALPAAREPSAPGKRACSSAPRIARIGARVNGTVQSFYQSHCSLSNFQTACLFAFPPCRFGRRSTRIILPEEDILSRNQGGIPPRRAPAGRRAVRVRLRTATPERRYQRNSRLPPRQLLFESPAAEAASRLAGSRFGLRRRGPAACHASGDRNAARGVPFSIPAPVGLSRHAIPPARAPSFTRSAGAHPPSPPGRCPVPCGRRRPGSAVPAGALPPSPGCLVSPGPP